MFFCREGICYLGKYCQETTMQGISAVWRRKKHRARALFTFESACLPRIYTRDNEMFSNISIKSRLIFMIGFFSMLMIAGEVVGLLALYFANDTMQSIYDNQRHRRRSSASKRSRS